MDDVMQQIDECRDALRAAEAQLEKAREALTEAGGGQMKAASYFRTVDELVFHVGLLARYQWRLAFSMAGALERAQATLARKGIRQMMEVEQ